MVTRKLVHAAAIYLTVLASIILVPRGNAHAQSVEDLKSLSIEDLANIEVTSVSKRAEPISRAPAAVYVITSEDIRRSGATTLPEVLRLAPNLHVARVDAASYAISARGFNSLAAANKLLVLIDGRSVYTPFHAGVFWDQQQVFVEDVDRIEVISGPGGTLWGANAVNGVINVISKRARDTQGGIAALQIGTIDHRLAARYGGPIGENGAWRAYGQGLQRGDTIAPNDRRADDDWDGSQAGFRTDWNGERDNFTVQGDIFRNSFNFGGRIKGGNLLGRWTRQLGPQSSLDLQTYYDRVDRRSPGMIDLIETFDVQAQHNFSAGERHQIVWGGGYRSTDDKFVNRLSAVVLRPQSNTVSIGNLFVQDTIKLLENLAFTAGTKIEYSSYTGFEYLPSGRLAWQVSDTDMLWAAISRAVRTPSRLDRDLFAAGVFDRASDLKSEKLLAYEAGWRGQPTSRTTLSVSLFYNDYDDLRVFVTQDNGRLTFGNSMRGYTYGAETWGDWRVTDRWRLSAGASLLQKKLRLKQGAIETALDQHQGNDPEYQAMLRSHLNVTDKIEFDFGLRAVDDLPSPGVPAYVAADVRLGWRATDGLELSIGAFNLFDKRHPETGDVATRREVRRSLYASARWRF